MKYKHKLFINFVLFISFVELLATSFNAYISYQDRLTFLSERAEILVDSQATALKTPLWNYDKQTINNILESLLSVPSFIQSEVSHLNNTEEDPIRLKRKTNNTAHILVHADILSPRDNSTIIGKLSLSFSSIRLDQYIVQRFMDDFIVIFILLCLNVLLVYFVLKWAIKPIEELSDTLHRLSEQDFQIEIPLLERDDELGDIARAANIFKNNGVELNTIQDSIQQKVYDQTKALAREKKKAERENRIKSKFLANMSHEIRTPLNSILGYGQLAKSSAENEKQKDYLDHIYNSALSLLGIVNDILDFSKIKANKLDIEKTEFNLKVITNQILEQLIGKSGQSKFELLGMIPETIPSVLLGDPLRLTQVLNNLLTNAIKFTKEGEVVLLVESIYQDKEKVRLSFTIRDTGIGIEHSKINKLFKAFEQADISTTREYGGTGLGLSISHQLVKLMGGEIHVESQLGQGSTFSFILPFEIAETNFLGEIRNTRVLSRLKILILSKNKQAGFIYKEYLRELSIQSDCLYSAEDAIKQFKQNSPSKPVYDYVFINDFFWQEDIFELVKQIRSAVQIKNLKIILITSPHNYKQTQGLVIKNNIQLDYILLKPVNTEKLLSSLQVMPDELSQTAQTEDKHWKPTAEQIEKISGAEILLVEDIDINRALACEILHGWGVKVSTADNGIEALSCINKSQYDLVLMDIQMPEMDGFEATQIIREELQLSKLPIIAMTALAMIGDKDKLLASGMNDYISKPINIRQLFYTLIKWIDTRQAVGIESPHVEVIADTPEQMDMVLPEFSSIDTHKGLSNTIGNSILYRDLLLKFKERLDNEVPRLLSNIERENFEPVKQILHNIKGISGNLGASKLAEMAVLLEGRTTEHLLETELDLFVQECRFVSGELSAIEPPALHEKTNKKIDIIQITELIENINKLIAKNSFKIDDTIPLLHKALNGHCQAVFDLLNEAIEQYDFNHAKIIMKQLLSCINKD
ncbi:MAG: response regulator [gamma proteobacterium symbiont of Taylorina sp.]|nr:response regulator [gamma proteobacterium symbiont of Taylorina sp.]